MDVCGCDRNRPRGGGNRGGDAAAVGGVCDRRGGGGGDAGGVGRCVTVVGKLTDGGEVDAMVGTVAMVDRGETNPAGVGVETSAGRAGVVGELTGIPRCYMMYCSDDSRSTLSTYVDRAAS